MRRLLTADRWPEGELTGLQCEAVEDRVPGTLPLPPVDIGGAADVVVLEHPEHRRPVGPHGPEEVAQVGPLGGERQGAGATMEGLGQGGPMGGGEEVSWFHRWY